MNVSSSAAAAAASSSFVPVLSLVTLLLIGPLFLATPSLAFFSGRSQPPFEKNPIRSTVQTYSSSSSSWSKIAEFDIDSESFRLIDTYDESSTSTTSVTIQEENGSSSSSIEYDLTSPREWLEYCETRHQNEEQHHGISRQKLDGQEQQGGGAYTVLRCDFLVDQKSWRIWGKDFHLDRLRESYRSLLHVLHQSREELTDDEDEPNEKCVQSALDSSFEAMNLLLAEAKTMILYDINNNNNNNNNSREKGGNSMVVVMLTLLWDPDPIGFQISDDGNGTGIRVRGHAFSTMKVSKLHDDDNEVAGTNDVVVNPNPSIQAVIGHLPPTANDDRVTNHHNRTGPVLQLPNRYQNFPQAKLSSWCRRRRLLEDIFKREDIGDVILTKQQGDNDDDANNNNQKSSLSSAISTSTRIESSSVELLEGLTSNLFVVYPGKILRTPPSTGVLGGYARQLIIDCAEKCGYRVEIGSISLTNDDDDGDSSSWKEVFLTSSIRLIIPVHRIFLPSGNFDEGGPLEMETFWEMPPSDRESNDDDSSPSASAVSASNALYQELMKQQCKIT